MLFFFFPRSGKKKIQADFFYYGKSSSVIHLDFEEIRFFCKIGCVFFFPEFLCGFCVFFFPRKSSHVIHSFNFGGRKKKHNPEKKNSFFIHSFDIPQKVHKNELFRGKKKYDTFGVTSFYFEGHNVVNIVQSDF